MSSNRRHVSFHSDGDITRTNGLPAHRTLTRSHLDRLKKNNVGS
jgi:hypothetical protein